MNIDSETHLEQRLFAGNQEIQTFVVCYSLLIQHYSYGVFWVSLSMFDQYYVPNFPKDIAHQASGLFLLGWTIFTVFSMHALLE
jgi:succinate-acetate transporter protein